MREQSYLDRAKLNPARTFKTPMDVVETGDIDAATKLAVLKAWEADERALLRAEDEGMSGGEHAHLHKVQAALAQLRKELCSTGATEQPPAWSWVLADFSVSVGPQKLFQDLRMTDLIVYGFPRSTFVNVARCSSSRIRSAIHQRASRSSAHE